MNAEHGNYDEAELDEWWADHYITKVKEERRIRNMETIGNWVFVSRSILLDFLPVTLVGTFAAFFPNQVSQFLYNTIS